MSELNPIFQDFSDRFVGRIRAANDIVLPKKLSRFALNYSIESLVHVDEYLAAVRADVSQLDQFQTELNNTMLWGGAYVGEVLRKNAQRVYKWIDYEDFMPTHPSLAGIIGPRTLATCAFLYEPKRDSMCMPINKVVRCIYEGPDNNVHYFATGWLD